jgi:hypothetical protein
MSEEMSARRTGTPLRVVGWMVVAALGVPVFVTLAIPFVLAALSGPFMSTDSRGMPVEPAWAGYVAQYGCAAVISSVVGALLGRIQHVRPEHGLVAGALTAAMCSIFYYGLNSLRGFPPTRGVDVLIGVAILAINVVPFMAFFLARAARKRIAGTARR